MTVQIWQVHRALVMGGDLRAAWEEEFEPMLHEVTPLPGVTDLTGSAAAGGSSWVTRGGTPGLRGESGAARGGDPHRGPLREWLRDAGAIDVYVCGYTDASLDRWADRCRGWLALGHDVHVYLDNDARGHAPDDAMRLLKRLR